MRSASCAGRPPCRGEVGDPEVGDDATAGRRREHVGERFLPDLREVGQTRQAAAHVQAIGRNAIAQADGAPQRRDDHDPRPSPPPRRRVEVGQPDRVVQNARVDRSRRSGRGVEDRDVAEDDVAQRRRDAEASSRVGLGADLDQGVEHRGAGRRQRGEGQAGWVERLAACDRGLRLRRRQQDQHDQFLPAVVTPRRRPPPPLPRARLRRRARCRG